MTTPTSKPEEDRRWKRFRRTNIAEMRPYNPGEDLSGISVSPVDTPELGGVIARNPDNHADQWYVARDYFQKNFEIIPDALAGDGGGE
ncbi:MAG: hypothetical protein ACIAQU_04165 [Phycisphaerales bacterium JB064]